MYSVEKWNFGKISGRISHYFTKRTGAERQYVSAYEDTTKTPR